MIRGFVRPDSLEEAFDILASGEFTPIAGGTDLIPQLRRGRPRKLLDISRLGLDFVKSENGSIEIGAASTHSRLIKDKDIITKFPLLSDTCALIGSAQVRNRGTIGGNIVNASPCADTAPTLIAFDAELKLLSRKGERNIKVSEFIRGPYAADIRPDEILYSIKCEIPDGRTGHSFIKLGRRQAVNISRLTLAVSMAVDNGVIKWGRIAGGSVFPVPARFADVEKMITSQAPSERLFNEAGKLAAEGMIRESGVRWSTPYKKPALAGLMARALKRAAGIELK